MTSSSQAGAATPARPDRRALVQPVLERVEWNGDDLH